MLLKGPRPFVQLQTRAASRGWHLRRLFGLASPETNRLPRTVPPERNRAPTRTLQPPQSSRSPFFTRPAAPGPAWRAGRSTVWFQPEACDAPSHRSPHAAATCTRVPTHLCGGATRSADLVFSVCGRAQQRGANQGAGGPEGQRLKHPGGPSAVPRAVSNHSFAPCCGLAGAALRSGPTRSAFTGPAELDSLCLSNRKSGV